MIEEGLTLNEQSNELQMSIFETFINQKQTQLQQLQKVLFQQIQQQQKNKQKTSELCQVFKSSVFPFFESLKVFHQSIVHQFKCVTYKLLRQMAQQFNTCLLRKDKQIEEQNQIISKIKQQIREIRFNNENQMTRRSKSKELIKSSFLDYHVRRIEKGKSQRELPRGELYQGQTKKIMREVQKTLRQDHSRQNVNQIDGSHKKYLKHKIQVLKNKSLSRSQLHTNRKP